MDINRLKRRIRSGPGRLRGAGVLTVITFGLLIGTLYAGTPSEAGAERPRAPGSAFDPSPTAVSGSDPAEVETPSAETLEELSVRLDRVRGGWAEVREYYETEIAPIERELLRFRSDSVLVGRIAVALVREAKRVDLEPWLLLAVLLVENPWLDPKIRSPVGAIGLMQVMPVHRGNWRACDSDLEDIDANICYGARIFAHYYDRTNGDLDRALLRYNGCVRGTNTPNCHQYPNHVFANAGRATLMARMSRGAMAGSP